MRLVAASVVLILTITAAVAQWAQFQAAGTGTINFTTLRIGAGGFATGLDIASDGTKVIRTDTYGAYLYNASAQNPGNAGGTGTWQQIVTSLSMPVADQVVDDNVSARGVVEIRIAPSNTSHFYMAYATSAAIGVGIYSSTNKGATWTLTNYARDTSESSNDANRLMGPFIAIDPANENVVYVGSESKGVQVTTDGGSTWNTVSAVGNAGSNAWNLIAFDPTSSVVGGKTQTIYISTYGTGVYRSTNGGTSWALTTGTPTTHQHMMVDRNGVLWLAANGGTQSLWKFASGAWSNLNLGGQGGRCHSIAVDPNNANNIVCGMDSGDLITSTDGGTTWVQPTFGNTRTATDIPWLAWTDESYMSNGDQRFDSSSKLWFAEGIGVWTTTSPGATTAYTSVSTSIEQLVARWIVSPWGASSVPIVTAEDRPVFRSASQTVYPSVHGLNRAQALSFGSSADWSGQNPLNIVVAANGQEANTSGLSSDGGQTWTLFTGAPGTATAGGCIALAASDTNNILWQQSNNGDPYYSTDGGATWNKITISGVPANPSETGWGPDVFNNAQQCAADRVNDHTFYMWNYGPAGATTAKGVYKTTTSGATWTHANSNDLSGGVAAFQPMLRTVPNNAGHLCFTIGVAGGSHPMATSLYCSIDAGTTMTALTGVADVWAFGFGKPCPTCTYPSLYCYCWVGGVGGVWRGTGNSISTLSWTQLSGLFPNNSLDEVIAVEGDGNIYGRVYLGFQGSGWAYGQFNYLLKRDLSPASNDNTPMGLNEAA